MLDLDHAADELSANMIPLRSQVETLEQRLENGWQLIEAREAAGASAEKLFGHFVALLDEYEEAVDRLSAA